jgi:nucleotide-binding universal stress UspA family protein
MYRFKRVMVLLDGSEFAEMALEPALAIASAMGSELVLFRVAQPIPRTRALAELPDVYNDVVAAAYREAEDYLQQVRAKAGYDRISVEHRPGEEGVARQIVDYAAKADVDLIVMSSHGYTGVKRWAYGSVADKVLQAACCATLLIRCDPGRSGAH